MLLLPLATDTSIKEVQCVREVRFLWLIVKKIRKPDFQQDYG